MNDMQKFATDKFGNRFRIGSRVLFAHGNKLFEAEVTDIEWSDGPFKLKTIAGIGKVPKEPTRSGEQVVLIDERAPRPNE